MSYKVAIVGRPNVGKSSLFNALLGYKHSIVHDMPGVTRDVISLHVDWFDQDVELLDTGGLDSLSIKPKDFLLSHVFDKALTFIKNAQMVLFVVDGITGLSEQDRHIAKDLRKMGVKVQLVVNKMDPGASSRSESEFFALGYSDYIAVSAEHKSGLTFLMEVIEDDIEIFVKNNAKNNSQDTKKKATENDLVEKNIKVALLGRPNVGKSTLFNQILGKDRSIVSDIAGTTRDSIDSSFVHNNTQWTFIDTAGIRKSSKHKQDNIEYYSVNRAKKAVDAADLVVLLLNSDDNITTQDQKIAAYIIEQRKSLMILANKWDLKEKGDGPRKNFREELYYRAPFLRFADVKFISALHGLGTGNLLKQLNSLYSKLNKVFSEEELREAYHRIMAEKAPMGSKGHILEFKRLSCRAQPTPTFFIRCNKRRYVPDALKKFWKNKLYQIFDLKGIPIKLVFHEHFIETAEDKIKQA